MLYFDVCFFLLKLLIQFVKDGIFTLGTLYQNRLSRCQFSSDTELKKKGRDLFKEKETIIDRTTVKAIKWYDNQGVILASIFAKACPLGIVQG